MKRRADSFFGLHFDLHPKENDVNLGADVSEEQIEKLLDRVRPDYVTYDCKGHEGFAGYETKVGVPAPLLQTDSLAVWRKATKNADVSLAVHYSGLQDFIQARINAQNAAQDREGKTDGRTMSVFSNYPDEVLIPQLLEAVEKYDLNGVWLDAECWGAQFDCSPQAAKAWKAYSGCREIPSEDDPRYGEFKQFHREAFERYLRKWVDALHRRYPDLDCCSNWAYTTMMPKKREAEIAAISGDFDPFFSVDRARTECRYLENTEFPWELQSWGFDLVDGQGPCQKAAEQIEQEAAIVLMHGGGYMNYFLPTRGGFITDEIIESLGRVSDFCAARKEDSFRSRPIYDIAVLYPTKSQLRRSDKVYTWWGHRLDELEGVLHAVIENGVSTTVLSEEQFSKRAEQLSCLFVPECDYLEEDCIAEITRFAERGGRVVLCGGKVSKLFESALGVKLSGTQNATATVDCFGEKLQLNGEWAGAEDSANVILYRYEGGGTLTNSYFTDTRKEGVSEVTARLVRKKPAAMLCPCGKGTFAALLWDFGKQYFKNHHFYARRIMGRLLDRIYPNRKILLGAPPSVDVSLRKNAAGQTVVHLCNTSNMPVGETRKFSDFIPCITDISVRVRSGRSPRRVIELPDGREIPFTYDGEYVCFTLKKLHIHAVIRLETQA